MLHKASADFWFTMFPERGEGPISRPGGSQRAFGRASADSPASGLWLMHGAYDTRMGSGQVRQKLDSVRRVPRRLICCDDSFGATRRLTALF